MSHEVDARIAERRARVTTCRREVLLDHTRQICAALEGISKLLPQGVDRDSLLQVIASMRQAGEMLTHPSLSESQGAQICEALERCASVVASTAADMARSYLLAEHD